MSLKRVQRKVGAFLILRINSMYRLSCFYIDDECNHVELVSLEDVECMLLVLFLCKFHSHFIVIRFQSKFTYTV